MKKESVTCLIEAFRGLPVMNEILNILEKKEFTNTTGTKNFDESVIGVMSPLTRAMYHFLETAGAKEFEKAKAEIISTSPIPCDGLSLYCLSAFAEAGICPYADALQKFNKEHNLQHKDFVRTFMMTILATQFPGAKIIRENFEIITSGFIVPLPEYEKYEDWEEMNLEELMEVSIKGTFLEEIADVLKNGQFIDIADSVIEGDVVIREMTLLEKAIFTVVNNVLKSLQPLAEENSRLLDGENFEVDSSPGISSESFMGGMVEVISISMQGLGKKSYKPKDKAHPDFIRVEELEKEILKKKKVIEPLRDIVWSIISMGIDPSQKNGYDVTGIRQGFQIVVYNKKEELAEVE